MENLRTCFDSDMERSDDLEKKEAIFTVMKAPEIMIQEERGCQLLSLLFKATNVKWGETETPLAKETANYFYNHPLGPEISSSIKNIYAQGVDEEAFYNLALTYQRKDRVETILEIIKKYKPRVKNPQQAREQVIILIESFDQIFSTSQFAEKFNTEISRDINERLEKLKETQIRIENLIDFFKPDSKTTDIQKLIFTPTDPLYKINSGRGFIVSRNEQVIISHIDNIDNQDHEFLHCIINPIIEKLIQQLTDKQKEKISQSASEKLKQDYGGGCFSLLCEEFIRAYNDVFKKGKRPESYEDFVRKISSISEEQFQKFLIDSAHLKARCAELGIVTIEDFKNKSREYFDRFECNQLRNLIFNIYEEYTNRINKDTENLEQFVLANFSYKIGE